ncbi:hypothetical protein J7E87_22470 [Streptomyces sp. ISL-1]|uniref:hypothetical protein n=1 Tax=Streptomyces sp. ISL-1 TaxID=2817657 RepID=UPI001BEC2A58|nr:hypothetical protein [Streptomyces sp. ISL-1]MBT2392117.1 hypothetical protein [Streptomyces sp. ISL-1]
MPSRLSTAIESALVSIPLQAEPTTKSHAIGFRQNHVEDFARVRNRKIRKACGQRMRQHETGRSREPPMGPSPRSLTPIRTTLPLEHPGAIEVVGFNAYESINDQLGSS